MPQPTNREKIIAGFHKLYLDNIKAETVKRGKLGGISGDELKLIFNETVVGYYEQLLSLEVGHTVRVL